MAITVDEVFRDYNTAAVPSSGDYKPPKVDIRRLLKSIAGGTSAVGDYRGAWDSGEDYIVGDLVEDGGSIWYAKAASTNVTPIEGASWTLFLPGVTAADGTINLAKFATSRLIGVTGGDFGMVSDLGTTNTDNNGTLQAAIDYAITNEQPLFLFGQYRVVGTIEINGPIRIFLAEDAEINFSGLGSSSAAFDLTHDDGTVVFEGAGTISGPSVATYVGAERAIQCLGTSTSERRHGLRVSGIEIKDFGSDGVYCQFVNDIVVDNCRIHNLGYAAAQFLSCDNGRYTNNTIYTITPGASANMYGLAITHDSANYDDDPYATTNGKLAAHPFSRGWFIAFNEVYDIAWEGLDCHGGYEVQIVHNRVYATKYGIAVPSSSGDATAFAGYNNIVAHNIVDGRNRDGTASGRENTGYGINLNGGSTVNQRRILCEGNILYGKGILTNDSSGAIQALWCDNLLIGSNVIDMWGGAAILVTLSSGLFANNQIGPAANSWSDNTCIRDASPSNRRQSFLGNSHDPGSGNAGAYGIQKYGGTPTYAPVSGGNNFIACTTAAISVAGGTVAGA